MKKVIFLFATLIITIMGLSFVGCSNDNTPTDTKIEYDLVKLTVDNYSDYIAINTDYSDYNLIALSESLLSGQYFYTASLIVHISTASAKPDLKFSIVKISYSPLVLLSMGFKKAQSMLKRWKEEKHLVRMEKQKQ